MAKFCSNCGKELIAGEAFCAECGAPVPADEPKPAKSEPVNKQETQPVNQAQPNVQPAYQPSAPQMTYQSSNVQPAPQPAAPQMTYKSTDTQPAYQPAVSGEVSTGYFFGMMFLYALPVLGWLICIITVFAAQNQTKKNFAKAMLIWLIIGLIFSILIALGIRLLGGMVSDYVNTEFGGDLGSITNMFDLG